MLAMAGSRAFADLLPNYGASTKLAEQSAILWEGFWSIRDNGYSLLSEIQYAGSSG